MTNYMLGLTWAYANGVKVSKRRTCQRWGKHLREHPHDG